MQNSLLNRRAMISGAIGMAALGSADIARSRGQTSAATPAAGGIPPGTMPIKPFALSEMRLTRIIASTRPFRNAGPRLEAESINDKTIVHSYGHGGCGWSLSWGAAEEAAALALSSAPSSVAVIGAGAIGLTTATVLRRAGVATTIYAQELPTESRSAGATGTWSADSRIAKTANASPQLADRIERLARRSYVAHQQYVGLSDNPAEFTPRYFIPTAADHRREQNSRDFLSISDRLSGMTPGWTELAPGSHPFPGPTAPQYGLSLTFNLAEYVHRLVSDFLMMGGAIRRAEFHSPTQVASLPHPVIVNCTGYGARALWKDESLIPIRGQIAQLTAQSDRLYGVIHDCVMALSRRDTLIVQYAGPDERSGMGIDDESPDKAEFLQALARIRPMFDWQRPRGA